MSFPGECDVARINQDDVEAVRERTDIVGLIQQYVGLKKQGRAFSGLCPFHTEKTASFTVDPAKQVYYCFGCQAGGNAFNFLMGVESLTFPESVERLAKQAGINLRYEGRSPEDRKAASRRQALFRANARAADLYHRHLMDHRDAGEARRYLEARGISKETAVEFGIGFAPGFPDFLLRRLAREFSPEILVEAGLALKDSSGSVRDRFRNRVTFPVNDLAGQAVGFGARLLAGEGPKYLNSPETPVYKKGEMLYNLHRAKAQVTDGGRAHVVEGYTDVIALHQGAVPTAVATCGTALGEGHFKLMSRFATRAVLAFDSDEAGARAAERAYGFMTQHAVEIRVLVLPEGHDPADFVQARGAAAFEELAEEAVPLVEYMIRRSLRNQDLRSPEGQARAVHETLPIVAGLEGAGHPTPTGRGAPAARPGARRWAPPEETGGGLLPARRLSAGWLQTAPFVAEQQSRPALLLVVTLGAGYAAARKGLDVDPQRHPSRRPGRPREGLPRGRNPRPAFLRVLPTGGDRAPRTVVDEGSDRR